jgi:hypothetical protein
MGGFQLFEHSDQPTQLVSETDDNFARGVGRFVRFLEFKDVLNTSLKPRYLPPQKKKLKTGGRAMG